MEGRNGGKLVTNRQHNLNFLGVFLGPSFVRKLGTHYHLLLSKSAPGFNSIGRKIVPPREELDNVNASNTEFLFGLFAEDEMSYRWGIGNGCSLLGYNFGVS